MTDQHERFSEQMAPYVRGELPAPEAASLEAHLETCEECSVELRGVRALVSMSPQPLDEMERARLHRAVLAATTGERTYERGSSARRGIAARIAPALGAAALFALFVFGAAQVFTGSSGDESGAGADSAAGAALEGNAEELARDGGPLGLPPAGAAGKRESAAVGDQATAQDGDGAAEGTGDPAAGNSSAYSETEAAALAGPPQPYFEPGPRLLSDPALRRLGSKRDPFNSFASAYRTGDGTDRDALTTALSMASPEPAEVRTCADGVFDLDPNALPAYGALGTYQGEYVLALGFVTAREGPLNNYEIWVWRVGDCAMPLTRISGRI